MTSESYDKEAANWHGVREVMHIERFPGLKTKMSSFSFDISVFTIFCGGAGVPFFVFHADGAEQPVGVSGAQEPDVLVEVMLEALDEA